MSPSPASFAASLEAQPGPQPRAASHSSAHPAARSGYSSWGCPSSDQRYVPSGAEGEALQSLVQHVLHLSHTDDVFEYGCVGAHLPVLFQVSDLLPQLLQARQSLRLSQLHPYQLFLKTRHVGVIW